MLEKMINEIANDFCCGFKILDDKVAFDTDEITSEVLTEYGINAVQYYPSVTDDDDEWINRWMEEMLVRPSNKDGWTDEDYSKVSVFRLIN